jgi:hypothetical protein
MPASAGKVIVIGEPDYCYGRGELRLRVERVDRGNPVRYDGENWYHVEGIQLGTTGVELGRRQVLVRGRRLPPVAPTATTPRHPAIRGAPAATAGVAAG